MRLSTALFGLVLAFAAGLGAQRLVPEAKAEGTLSGRSYNCAAFVVKEHRFDDRTQSWVSADSKGDGMRSTKLPGGWTPLGANSGENGTVVTACGAAF
ncbi:hypothetical protein L6R49_06690 [Myxococcota bacterium]|nr:hypothetical protein [Myxococcota bacterium]